MPGVLTDGPQSTSDVIPDFSTAWASTWSVNSILQAGTDCGAGGVDSAETQWTQFGVRYGGSDDGVSSFLVIGNPVLGWC